MCKALIIGAGGVGTVVAQKIAANPIFSDVMLASRTKSKCDAVAAAIGGNRVKTAEVDADSVPQLCELFRAFKPDIVVNVARFRTRISRSWTPASNAAATTSTRPITNRWTKLNTNTAGSGHTLSLIHISEPTRRS